MHISSTCPTHAQPWPQGYDKKNEGKLDDAFLLGMIYLYEEAEWVAKWYCIFLQVM